MAGGYQEICCDECGVEIAWRQTVIDGRTYCCRDCALGLECDCASGDPRWRPDAGSFFIGSVEGGAEASFDIDNYAFD